MTHYFPHVNAAAVIVENGVLAVGDPIHIKGATTDFKQRISSLQINRQPIPIGKRGDEVGIQVKKRVRIHDRVYKIP